MVALVTGVAAHELNGGQARAGEEPAPDVVEEESEAEVSIEANEEVHQCLVQGVNVVLPYADDRDEHVGRADEGVQNEQQEVSLVLEADAIVRENAVVAHLEDTGVADGAMVCPGGLEIIADVAFTIPEASEISHGLRAIFHESLDILL